MSQLFLSHTWKLDELGRDTHRRALELYKLLMTLGWSVWLDEFEMHSNIDSSMANGIDEAECVIMLLTRAYARKINKGARSETASNDNCLKEFGYALFREKRILPVIFEVCMQNPNEWSPGVIPMRLAMTYCVDGTGSLFDAARNIHNALTTKFKLVPMRTRCRRLMRQKSRENVRRTPNIRPLWPLPDAQSSSSSSVKCVQYDRTGDLVFA